MARLDVRTTCIVLDLDDTLILERRYVHSGFAAVAAWAKATLRLEGLHTDLISSFERGVRGNTFNIVLESRGLRPNDSIIREMISIYRAHSPTIELEPDAESFLSSVSGRRTGLITDGPAIMQWSKVRALDLERRIDTIVVTDDHGPGFAKPSEQPFRLIMTRLPDFEQYMYIGDNPRKDFQAPHALGWATIRMRRIDGLHSLVATPAYVDDEIASFDEFGVC